MCKILKYLELSVAVLVVAGVTLGLDFSQNWQEINTGKYIYSYYTVDVRYHQLHTAFALYY